jgi:hypothetical protein
MNSWIGKLSYRDRLVLINSILTSFPIFLLSFFEIPKGVRKRLDFYRSPFSCQSDGHKNASHINVVRCNGCLTRVRLML